MIVEEGTDIILMLIYRVAALKRSEVLRLCRYRERRLAGIYGQ
jgi:hypothetical protein